VAFADNWWHYAFTNYLKNYKITKEIAVRALTGDLERCLYKTSSEGCKKSINIGVKIKSRGNYRYFKDKFIPTPSFL